MPTTISDLWIPDIWLATMREKQATFPSLLNSGVAVNNPKASELASGPGEVAMIPFFRDITDQDDELQIENAEPLIDNIITAGVMKAVARDIERAVTPLKPGNFDSKRIRQLIRNRDHAGLEAMFANFPDRSLLHGVSVVDPRFGGAAREEPGADRQQHAFPHFPINTCRLMSRR